MNPVFLPSAPHFLRRQRRQYGYCITGRPICQPSYSVYPEPCLTVTRRPASGRRPPAQRAAGCFRKHRVRQRSRLLPRSPSWSLTAARLTRRCAKKMRPGWRPADCRPRSEASIHTEYRTDRSDPEIRSRHVTICVLTGIEGEAGNPCNRNAPGTVKNDLRLRCTDPVRCAERTDVIQPPYASGKAKPCLSATSDGLLLFRMIFTIFRVIAEGLH